MMTPTSGSTKENVAELARQLLYFEESLDWEYVDAERFRRMRSAWRAQLGKATILRHLETSFRDFVKVVSEFNILCHSVLLALTPVQPEVTSC